VVKHNVADYIILNYVLYKLDQRKYRPVNRSSRTAWTFGFKVDEKPG
jgi:hypothetical protein